MISRFKRLLVLATVALFLAAPAQAEGLLPLFDTHVHYSEDAWSRYKPEEILDILRKAGVVRGAFSSSPDEGTVRLYNLNKDMVTPMLRPYRESIGSSNWFADEETVQFLIQRLDTGIYKGVGEVHLFDAKSALTPQMKRLADELVKRDLYFQVHSGALPVVALFTMNPKLKVIWAHAGLGESPGTVATVMEKFPTLIAELALREWDVAPGGGTIDPEWKDMLIKYADRIMFGTDTWITERWPEYLEIVKAHRAYLDQLPPEVAEAIGFRNAVRIFGKGKLSGFPD